MATGTLLAPEGRFCRTLKRSIESPSIPLLVEIEPELGGAAAPKLEALGLAHKVTAFGETPKSYLPARKRVSPAWYSVAPKSGPEPVPPFCTPITYPDGELDLTIICSRKLLLSEAVNAPT